MKLRNTEVGDVVHMKDKDENFIVTGVNPGHIAGIFRSGFVITIDYLNPYEEMDNFSLLYKNTRVTLKAENSQCVDFGAQMTSVSEAARRSIESAREQYTKQIYSIMQESVQRTEYLEKQIKIMRSHQCFFCRLKNLLKIGGR